VRREKGAGFPNLALSGRFPQSRADRICPLIDFPFRGFRASCVVHADHRSRRSRRNRSPPLP